MAVKENKNDKLSNITLSDKKPEDVEGNDISHLNGCVFLLRFAQFIIQESGKIKCW